MAIDRVQVGDSVVFTPIPSPAAPSPAPAPKDDEAAPTERQEPSRD